VEIVKKHFGVQVRSQDGYEQKNNNTQLGNTEDFIKEYEK